MAFHEGWRALSNFLFVDVSYTMFAMYQEKILHILLPILLAVVIVYPSSPILFQLLVGDHQIAIAIFAVVILAVSLLWGWYSRIRFNSFRRVVVFYCISVGAISLASFAVTGMGVGVRDLLFLLAICSITLYLPRRSYVSIVENYAFIFSVLMIISGLIVIAFFLGIIEKESWVVSRSLVSESNPAFSRQEHGDFDYFMPFYLALIPISDVISDQGFGFSFIRQPFIFTEPTYVWAYLAPLWFLVYSDKAFRRRALCLFSIGIALIFSFSIWGILSAAMTLYIIFLSYLFKGRTVILLLVVFSSLLIIYNYDLVLASIGSNKLDQFEHYFEHIDMSKYTIAPFGVNLEGANEEVVSYGALILLIRYGYIGAIFYIFWLIFVFVWALKLLQHWRSFKVDLSHRLFFASLVMSLLLAVKMPQITLLSTFLLLGYWDAKQASNGIGA